MNTSLQQLLALPHLWQASQARQINSVVATGYQNLDQELHDHGWPSDGTTELFVPQPGIGELRLLLPAMRRVQQQRPWLVFIAPPFLPYASALMRQNINPNAVLIVRPQSSRDLLWSAEQILQSGCCAAVLTWAMDLNLGNQQLRRLQRAAHRGQCWHSLFRHPRFSRQASPSVLRIQLSCSATGVLRLRILKQRGGWGGQQLNLTLPGDLTQLQRLSPEQLPLPRQQFARPYFPDSFPDNFPDNATVAKSHEVVANKP